MQGDGTQRFSVVWEADRTPEADSADHAAQYATTLARALASAGYPPERLEIAIEEPSPVRLDLEVHGEVPGLDETSFASIARIAVSACRVWQTLPLGADVRLRAKLGAARPAPPPPAVEPQPAPAPPRAVEPQQAAAPAPRPRSEKVAPTGSHAITIASVGLVAVAALVYLVTHPPSQMSLPLAAPATAGPVATASPIPLPTAALAAGGLRTMLDEQFLTPSGGWPNDPAGTAWFGVDGYHLIVREPGQFVAVSAPLPGPVQEVVVSASFVKTNGPTGGGYGLVLREQGTRPLDGRTQLGRFLLLEVSDGGEIGIWQREGSRWVGVMPWTRSDAVRPGLAQNELQAIGQADQISFVVNGQHVAGMAYAGLPTEGGVGLFVGGDFSEVTISRLTVQVP